MAHIRTLTRSDVGTSYEVRWRHEGRFHQATFRDHDTATAYAAELDRSHHPDPAQTGAPVTRAEVIEASLRASAPRLRPRTLTGYRQSYDHHILPTLGHRLITTITPTDIELWLLELIGKGLAPASIAHHHAALSRVFTYAQRHSLTTHNPCAGAELPEPDDLHSPTLLTPTQIDTLADHLDHTPPDRLMVRLTGYTGLRAGELAALTVNDIDLTTDTLHVRHALAHLSGDPELTPPKSHRAREQIPSAPAWSNSSPPTSTNTPTPTPTTPPHPYGALSWPGRTRGNHPTPDYGRHPSHSALYHRYRTALAELGLPPTRFHDLRHSAAALWLTAGIPLVKVSRWLGHANTAFTDRLYGDLLPHNHHHDLTLIEAYLTTLNPHPTHSPETTPRMRDSIPSIPSTPRGSEGNRGDHTTPTPHAERAPDRTNAQVRGPFQTPVAGRGFEPL